MNIAAFYSTPWALISESYLRQLERYVLNPQAAGRGQVVEPERYQNINGVAVIPLKGMVMQSSNWMLDFFGGTSTERFSQDIAAAVADPAVKSIVMNVASPGGSVFGVQEAFDSIMAARQSKRIVAVSNSMMASAAYYLASAAHEIVSSPGALTGSIGVYQVHEDISGMVEQAGVKVSMIYAGKYKVEGNEFEPLSDSARASMQEQVDYYYSQFVGAVARGRNTTAEAVRAGFGQGRALTADKALSSRLVDRVATLTQVINDEAGRAAMQQSSFSMDAARLRQAQLELETATR